MTRNEHRKPGVSKNPESPRDGWPGCGLWQWYAKEKCVLKQSPGPGLLLPQAAPSVQGYSLTHSFGQARWHDAPTPGGLRPLTLGQCTMTAVNPNAKPSGRGTKCHSLSFWRGAPTTTWWRWGSSTPPALQSVEENSRSQIVKVHIFAQPHLTLPLILGSFRPGVRGG